MATDDMQQPNRWTLVRDIAVFQVKLIVDGLRDVLLVPVSLTVGLVSLFGRGASAGTGFYELLRIGRRSEQWINLFGAATKLHGQAGADEPMTGADIDDLIARVESYIIDEYRKGDVTAQAKANLDRALDSVKRRVAFRRDSRR